MEGNGTLESVLDVVVVVAPFLDDSPERKPKTPVPATAPIGTARSSTCKVKIGPARRWSSACSACGKKKDMMLESRTAYGDRVVGLSTRPINGTDLFSIALQSEVYGEFGTADI